MLGLLNAALLASPLWLSRRGARSVGGMAPAEGRAKQPGAKQAANTRAEQPNAAAPHSTGIAALA